MNTVVVEHVSKRFGPTEAVKDVSLHVAPGEIFGLLGPNGAGKTTLIRMMLDILRPDQGRIAVFDGPMTEAKKDRIGYLPEERGLYADIKLMNVILYLASLKGLKRKEAARRAETYMRQLNLWEHKDKKLRQLSRGMHQKAQFIVTILHDPDLIIVDEPFSGLDPVNTQLIRDILLGLREAGKSIIMSTHQMHQVEAMCDRIALIHHGHNVLDGPVMAVRRQFAGNSVTVSGSGPFATLPQVQHASQRNGSWHLLLAEGVTPQTFLRDLAQRDDCQVEQFAVALPSLHDIFIQIVGSDNGEAAVD
ncbi:MAG: ATP-binding cassette domain-containing protein [Ardenticatenaceae bacterium]|nr:ATP-binding cassette domain-containing protein [Ardenticatenaceae bacterium]